MTEREKLRKLAEAATPGPWEAHHVRLEGVTHWYVDSPRVILVSDGATPKDSAYIAAANPAAVIDLLDQLDAAEVKLAAVRALVDAFDRDSLQHICEGIGDPHCGRCWIEDIRRAIDGEVGA